MGVLHDTMICGKARHTEGLSAIEQQAKINTLMISFPNVAMQAKAQQQPERNILIELSEMAQANVPATDPAVYDAYREKWSTLPDAADAWLARAREVAEVLAQDAAQRDQDNKSPRAEVALLKHSGLLKLLGPKKYGGGEQPWHVGYKAIREVAKGDGCVSTVNM